MRIVIVLLILLLVLFAASYGWIFEGPLADRLASKFLSQRSGLPVEVSHASVRHWTRVRFESGQLIFPGLKEKFRFGRGELNLQLFPGFGEKKSSTGIRLTGLELPRGFWNKTLFTFLSQYLPMAQPVRVDRLGAAWVEAGDVRTLHVLDLAAGGVSFRGGLRFERRRVTGAHALLLVSDAISKKIPKEILPRLVRRAKGQRGIRILFRKHVLTLVGAAGIFFKAQWQP